MCLSAYWQWYMSSWSKFVVDSLGCTSWIDNILTTLMTHMVVDKRTDNPIPHSICFVTTISTSKKRFFLFSARPIAWHVDDSNVVWTLIDIGKLTNQIARLVAIVVKKVPGLTYGEPCTPLPPFCFVIKAEIRATLIPGTTERRNSRLIDEN